MPVTRGGAILEIDSRDQPMRTSEPWSVAEEVATFVAGLVVTTGDPVAVSVVKVL